jgi:hypothetical protein
VCPYYNISTLTRIQHGVTSINPSVDIVQFFSSYIAQDLQAASGSVHPILQVDAIRFLYTFRNQVMFIVESFWLDSEANLVDKTPTTFGPAFIGSTPLLSKLCYVHI